MTDTNDCCSFSNPSFSFDNFSHLRDRFTKLVLELAHFLMVPYSEQTHVSLHILPNPFHHPFTQAVSGGSPRDAVSLDARNHKLEVRNPGVLGWRALTVITVGLLQC